jgi:hypothetical protein
MGDSDDSQDSGDTSTTGTDSNSFESGAEERRAHYPDVGYNEVEINLGRPPGNALTKLREYLKLSAITLRPATSFEDYVVYDAHGNAYDHDTLNESEEEADQPDVDALVKTARSGDNRERRIALLRLANVADETPKAILSIVPQLTAELDSAEPAIQAETLNILSLTAREFPDQVTPAADAVIGFLDFDHHSTLQEDATSFVKAVAEQDPDAVVGAAPKLAALLQDDLSAEQVALSALRHIAETDPDAVVPAVPQILTYIEESQTGRRIGGLAVLGTISKAYPHVAEDVVPTARSLLDSENYKIRANAAGLLADFADEYPDQVRPAVPRTIELLGDDDKKVRNCSATARRTSSTTLSWGPQSTRHWNSSTRVLRRCTRPPTVRHTSSSNSPGKPTTWR